MNIKTHNTVCRLERLDKSLPGRRASFYPNR